MSFIRPEITETLYRWREVIAGAAVAILGLWTATQGGYLLTPTGLALLALGTA